MFVAIGEPEIIVSNQSIVANPSHQRKALGTTESVRDFYLNLFYQETLHKCLCLCHVVTIGERHWRKLAATFESRFTSVRAATSVSCGVPIFVWVLINVMWWL